MIGLIVGTVCLLALVAQLARHRYGWHGRYAVHHGPHWHRGFGGHHGYGGHHRGRAFYGPGSRRAALYSVLERLDTTPGQDRAITAALQSAAEQARAVREPLRELRRDLASAMQSDAFERAQIEALFTRAEGRLRELRATAVDTLERVHSALEPEQRKRLGGMLAEGGFRPFRNW